MDPVGKALWFIESHFAGDITLEEIAGVSGISRFHLCRAFGEATGHSVMRYVRGRRLTEAARSLSTDATDILPVALDAGYGSHEAFTRAFRDQFGLTPESVRTQRHLDNLALVEPIRMDQTRTVTLESPRFESGKTLLIAGLAQRYSFETCHGIPSQWQRFTPYIGNIPGEVRGFAYGVRKDSDDAGNLDYMCGVEVASFDEVPAELSTVRIPARRYAVFRHRDHISAIRDTHSAIWTTWLPESGHEVADAPDFERYGEDFDPQGGTGVVEIWIPIRT
jgi:AraC family transcriptional regulator